MARTESTNGVEGAPTGPDGRAWVDPVERIISGWRTELPNVDTSPLRIIARIARLDGLIEPALRATFSRDNLNVGLFDVLAALRRAGEPYRSTPTELARLTMLTTGGITGRIDRLEEAGLIEREPSAEDRRITYVQLTPKGVEVVDAALQALLATERRLLHALTPAQAKRLAGDLAALERSVATAPSASKA